MTGDRNINLGSGNYNERIEGDYIQGNYYNAPQKQNLAQAAAEIQELLEQLDKSYDTGTTSGKMQVASETIETIENNQDLKARIISALKVGGVNAFEQFLNHPAASFVIGALEDWQKTSNTLSEAKPKQPQGQIVGTSGQQLLRFAGTISSENLQSMSEAIEKDCEQIELDEW